MQRILSKCHQFPGCRVDGFGRVNRSVSSSLQQGVKGALPNLWQRSRKSLREKGLRKDAARRGTAQRRASERTEAKEGRWLLGWVMDQFICWLWVPTGGSRYVYRRRITGQRNGYAGSPECRIERYAAGCGPLGDDFAIPLWLDIPGIHLLRSNHRHPVASPSVIVLLRAGSSFSDTLPGSLFREEDRIYFHGGENG